MKSSLPLLLAGLAACGGGRDADRPNVVLVSIDSLRADHVGCYGYERDTTPNLDRMARDGVLFRQHVSSSSWTLPAHAAMFTSVADSVHGCVEATGTALNPAFTTLAERFADQGYATGGFYGGPYLHAAFGLGQGFDEYTYAAESASLFDPDDPASWGNDPNRHARTHRGVTNEGVYGAARGWMERHKDEPFFAFVHLWDVHYDFTPPAPYDGKFTDPAYDGPIDGRHFAKDHARYSASMSAADLAQLIALYDGEIAWTDTFLGRLRADLADWGLTDDTVVAITSDHGTEFFDHGQRGHRLTLFDEVVRVPLVIWAPGRLRGGVEVDAQTRAIDLGPTLLELADLPAPGGVMGSSLAPAARGGPLGFEDNVAVCELYSLGFELRAVRVEGAKFLRDERDGAPVPERWYDLGGDPGEQAESTEFGSGRGAELRRAYGKALQDLNEAIAARPGGAVAVDLSAEILRELEEHGYAGGDEDG